MFLSNYVDLYVKKRLENGKNIVKGSGRQLWITSGCGLGRREAVRRWSVEWLHRVFRKKDGRKVELNIMEGQDKNERTAGSGGARL